MAQNDNEKPHLKLAVENDQTSIKRHRANQEVGYALRELTANLMRVSRGAGKPYDIGRQCGEVVRKFQAYKEELGHWPPSWDLAAAIRNERDLPASFKPSDDEQERMHHEDTMISGALQIVASRLLGQGTQAAAGRSEFARGFRDLMEHRLEQRRAREFAEKVEANRKKAKPATKKKPRGHL